MKIILRILKWFSLAALASLVGAAAWLYFLPPELLRVGTAYAAKIVCSSVFVSERDPGEVLSLDVQAPGHPLLKRVTIERDGDSVSASLFGVIARQTALHRPGLGCTVVADGDIAAARAVGLAEPVAREKSDLEWPLGDQVSRPTSPPVEALLADDALAGPGMRALVVVKDGRIIGERYGESFNAETPLLGWSMTKTVTAALVGLRVADGKLAYEQDRLFVDWTDDRARIKLADLLAMQSGLALEESYGDVNDVTRMLFLEPDQAAFVRAKPLETPPGTQFEYTTGSAVLLTRLWMNTFADPKDALAYPQKALFGRIGMSSAVMETDESGTFSGGSLMYATGRDWARFGLLIASGGDWNGSQVLPPAFIERVLRPTETSGGVYTEAQAWKYAAGDRKDKQPGLPVDTVWALGHDGQFMAIVPSENLVVVRLGLTPNSMKYRVQELVEKLVEAARLPVPDPEPDTGVIPQ